MNKSPLVSICCATYNQESYISQAIEGFLMQRTTFPIEIIIHDDASTDGTAEIIKSYARQYKNLIIPIFQKENQWSRGKRPFVNYIWPQVKGKYIAICEGDDYWTDPLKLQEQIVFMEKNPKYSLCFHNADVIYENSRKKTHSFFNLDKNEFNVEDIISEPWFIPTPSILFRKNCFEAPRWYDYVFGGDLVMQLILATKGKIYGINKAMCVYRKNEKSVSSNVPAHYTTLKKIETLSYFNMHTNFAYNQIIQNKIKSINRDLYSNALFSRPLFARLLSYDYITLKIRNILQQKKHKSIRIQL